MSVSTRLASRRPASGAGRAAILLLLVLTLLAMSSTSANAVWTTSGAGTGQAVTGTLNAPTATTASASAGSGTVAVGWTASAGPVTPLGYYVQRTKAGDGTTAFACGTSATNLVTAPCTDSSVPDGTYTYAVTAVRGSWTAAGAASSAVTVSNAVGTTTVLSSSTNPSAVGQNVTYTATVSTGAGGGTPTGTVTFTDGGVAINSCSQATLSGGKATCTMSYAAVGSHTISATYNKASGFTESTSAGLSQTVDKAASATTLTATPNPSVTGQTVTYTAAVTVTSPGSGSPTGMVTFQDGGNAISCGTDSTSLTGGLAKCTVTYSAAGGHSVTAVYSGDSSVSSSTSQALAQTVNQPVLATTNTTVTSTSPGTLKTAATVTYSATVRSGSGTGTPSGTVTFKDGSTPITCAGGNQTLNASGLATCQTSFQTSGTHTVTAAYGGDATYAGSTGGVTQRVVSANVAGLGFANVLVGGQSVTPACSGTVGSAGYICTVPATANGNANNATVSANVSFVTAAGSSTSYSAEVSPIEAVQTGKTPGSTTVTIPGGAVMSTATVSAQKNGSNPAQVTVTFTDGGTTWTAVLKVS